MKRLAVFALSLAVLAAGCSKTGVSTNPSAGGRVNSFTVPHVLRYATGEDFSSLNPMLSQQTTLGLMASLTMAWLVRWDVHNHPYPELATAIPTMANGGVSKDGLTITYHLRKGVKWSDGAPFTADDVVWSTSAVLNPANNITSRTGWDLIKNVAEPDKYTVIFHMKKPYSPFIQSFFSTEGANPCILPKHLLAKYPNINNVAYNSLPVGIGPFKYKVWKRGQEVVMVPDPLYWRGLPKLHEVDFMIVPDANTILTQVEAKEIDLWYNAPQNRYNQLKQLAPYTVYVENSYYFRHLDFNTSTARLSDPAVRQALRYATDRPSIIKKIYEGIGNLQDQPAPQTAPYWDPSIKPVPFDIAKANALLDAAGWKRGADGIRSKNGAKLALDVAVVTGDPQADGMFELIRGWWKQIGVSLSIQHYLSSLMFAPYADGGILYKGKFDVVYFQWGSDAIGDYSFIYGCDQIPPNGQNVLHWCNQPATAATHALFGHFDQTQRNGDVKIIEEQLDKEVPTIVVMGTQQVWVWNKDFKNFQPNAVSPFDNFMNADI